MRMMLGFHRYIVIIALIGLIGVSQGSDDLRGASLSRDDAYGALLAHVPEGNTGGRWVYAAPAPVPAGSTVATWYGDIVLPERDGWLFFIDDRPMAGWAHPCRYVHVDMTGAVTVKDALGPPEGLATWEMKAGSIRTTVPPPSRSRTVTRGDRALLPPCSDTSRSYAVLISGGADPYNNWERYYGDISFMFKTLVNDYGYAKDHIHVLMSDGTDPAPDQHTYTNTYINSNPDLDGDGHDDVEYAATKANITAVFSRLGTALGAGDRLFIFTTDHGGPEHTPQQGTRVILNLWDWGTISDAEFATEVNRVSSIVPVLITMEQCYSGGFVDDLVPGLPGQERVIATAANAYESSYSDTFSTLWISGVAGHGKSGGPVDADANGDGRVSMREAFEFAKAHDNEPEHPQYGEVPTGIGPNLALASCYAPTFAACFTATPTSGYPPLAVQFADTSTGLPISWSWTFGDGGTSTLRNPDHTFAAAGTYTVSLVVRNATGASSGPVSRTVTVKSTASLGQAVDAPALAWTTNSVDGWDVDLAMTHDGEDAARSGAIDHLTSTDLSTVVAGPAALSFWWKVSSEPGWDFLSLFVDGVEVSRISGEVPWTRREFVLAAGSHTVAWRYGKDSAASAGQDAGWVDKVSVVPLSTSSSVSFSAYPESGTAPLSVQFLDNTPDAMAWRWVFGDGGASTDQNPVHVFEQPGLYSVSLIVTDSSGRTATRTMHHLIRVADSVTPAPTPVADFSANATSGAAPMTVAFTDASSPEPSHRWWQFGDGESSTDADPEHTYAKQGTYTVNLTVWTALGQATVSKSAFVTVGPDSRAPVANFTMSRSSGAAPLYIKFTDTSTGDPNSWKWSFGGLAWTSIRNPSVVFRAPGTYAVTLTARNAFGTSTATRNMTVTGRQSGKGDAVSVVG
jgi:PKD repeat protein